MSYYTGILGTAVAGMAAYAINEIVEKGSACYKHINNYPEACEIFHIVPDQMAEPFFSNHYHLRLYCEQFPFIFRKCVNNDLPDSIPLVICGIAFTSLAFYAFYKCARGKSMNFSWFALSGAAAAGSALMVKIALSVLNNAWDAGKMSQGYGFNKSCILGSSLEIIHIPFSGNALINSKCEYPDVDFRFYAVSALALATFSMFAFCKLIRK